MVKDLNDPTNVDTIPAMLTDGEFVLNKEATAMYGPLIEQMNNHGLMQRQAENQMVQANIGKKISKIHGEGYTAPGQAYAIAKSMGYNTGGLVGFLKEKEGYRDKAYQDQAGVWTIGYGRTTNPDGSPIKPGQTTSKEKEDSWLNKRAASERAAVNEYAKKHGYDWSEGQKDALASFRYNVGNIDQLTAGGKRTNEEIQKALPQYNKAGGQVSEGLVNRRNAELAMWGAEGKKPSAPPPAEAPPQVGFDPVQMAQQLVMPKQMIPAQHVGLRGRDPEYIESLAAGGVSTYNGGGPVQYLRNGGRANITEEERERRRLARLAAANNVSRGRNVARQAPLVAPTAPQQPASGSAGRNVGRAGVSKSDPFVQQYPNSFDVGPVPGQGVPPQIEDQPPVPGSDEAILQGSSQSVEQQEAYSQGGMGRGGAPIEQLSPEQIGMAYDAGDPRAIAYADNEEQQWRVGQELNQNRLDQSVAAAETDGAEILRQREEALQNQLAGLQGTPEGAQVIANQEGSQFNIPELNAPPVRADAWGEAVLPEDVQEGIGGMNFQADAPSAPAGQDPRGEGTAQQKQSAAPKEKSAPAAEKRAAIENAAAKSEEVAPEVQPEERAKLVADGRAAAEKMSEPERNKIASTLKETFGDLFDRKELARMGVLMLGGMITGMSPGQALAFAGTQYLNRLDAKEATMDSTVKSLITGGKYTPDSIATFKETGDPSVLIPAEALASMEETGQLKTFYSDKGKIEGRQVKVGENKIWVDQNNKPIDVHKFGEDASLVPGTVEFRDRITKESKDYTTMLEDIREARGTTTDKYGKSYATDIVPSVQGREIANWALKNKVPPEAMATLIDNAYAEAMADSRGGDKKVRDLTPYLNTQYVKSQVGDPTLFQDKTGQTISSEKIQSLMNSYGSVLRSAAPDKYGQMSNTAISTAVMQQARRQWTMLDPDTQKNWMKRANKGESGFYLYLQNELHKTIQ